MSTHSYAFHLYGLITLFIYSCAVPVEITIPEEEELVRFLCDSDCPSGQYCRVINGEDKCIVFREPIPVCDYECPPGTQCRLDTCLYPDLEGSVCEFDDVCKEEELCILGHCTLAGVCEQGEIIQCYTGPPGTRDIGACHGGWRLCENGVWSNCLGEVTPLEEVGLLVCNGLDDDCDGDSDMPVVEELDIVFLVDGSGSMINEIDVVLEAVYATAQWYTHNYIKLGIVIFPHPNDEDDFWTIVPMLGFEDFAWRAQILAYGMSTWGGNEASWDLPGRVTIGQQQDITLRPEAKRVLIMFTDENGQTYSDPPNTEASMCQTLADYDTDLYVFTQERYFEDFDECASVYLLAQEVDEMTAYLRDINENICAL